MCLITDYFDSTVWHVVFVLCSPLDDIIDKLGGPSHVAEMTGRRGRIVRTARGLQFELRGSDSTTGVESLNIKEVCDFIHNQH